MPFGKLGNTNGLTFGFESEIIGKRDSFTEEVDFDDEDDLISELNIDRSDFDEAYQEWLDAGNEGEWTDWINNVGLTDWWRQMRIDSYEYGVVDNEIVRFVGWFYAIEVFSDRMKEDLDIENIVTSYDEQTPIHDKDYSDWYIEGDGSVHGDDRDDHAFEVISPIFYHYNEFADTLKRYLNWIVGHWHGGVYTNRSTGFHVNIGMDDAERRIDPLKLLLFSGEKWVTKLWREGGNGYTDELLPVLNDKGLPRSVAEASAFVKEFTRGLTEKSYAINFLTLFERGYIEFRPIGNQGYEHRVDDILNHVSRFVQLVQIASDPNLYSREYAKKLGQLIGGGQHDATVDNLTFDKRLISKWLDKENLSDNDRNRVMDARGNVTANAFTLIRLCGYLDMPQQVIKAIIKYSGMTRDQYIESLQSIAGRSYIMDEPTFDKVRSILDPYFGVSGPLPEE